MGLVRVTAEIGQGRDRVTPVRFLADTGSLYTCVTPPMASDLGLDLSEITTIVTAGGERIEAPVGFAFVRIGDRDGGTLVTALNVPEPLLGSVALQALGVKVNPQEETIEFTAHYPPKA